MKIAIFISSFSEGGAERVACNLASYLVRSGHFVEIITISKSNNSYVLDSNVSCYTLERKFRIMNRLIRKIIKQIRLFKYILYNKNDIFIVMLPTPIRSLFMYRAIIKVPIVISERYDPSLYTKRTQLAMQACAKKADGMVFQTENVQNWYREFIGDKSIVIPNAINNDFLRDSYTGVFKKTIFAAGRLTEQKNFSLLINAFAVISKDYVDYNLVIFGEGPLLENLKLQVKRLCLDDRVRFPGFVNNIGDQLSGGALFVLSSNAEGMPNVLIEAMALGLPVISTDCPSGGPRYLINNGENGLLVPVGDESSLVIAMRKMLADSCFARKCGRNAREINNTLAPEKIYSQWEKFIMQIQGLSIG